MRRYDDIANNEEYADTESPDSILMQNEEQALGFRLEALGQDKRGSVAMQKADKIETSWTEKIFPLIDLAARKPEIWRVLKIKLRNPGMSSREIAKEAEIPERTIRHYLKEAAKVIPGLGGNSDKSNKSDRR